MSFFEDRFPDRIAAGARGGPSWKTSRAITGGGYRNTNKEWSSPLHFYNVSQAVKLVADFEEVLDFFHVVYGAYDGFRFKDFADFQAGTRGVCTLVSGSIYQFYKRHAFGSRSFLRKITKPVAGTLAVFRTRSAVVTNITSASTIDTTTGQVTVSGHVAGDTYTWTGEFDVPCAFGSDLLEAEMMGPLQTLALSWSSIPIEEIRIRA